MAQSWDITLLLYEPATGFGNTTSSGYGTATAAQGWPVTLHDGTAVGYGNTGSVGFDDGGLDGAGEVTWYDVVVTVLAEGATRPFLAPLDVGPVTAPLSVGHVLAPLGVGVVYAPLDIHPVLAPLDMETDV